MARTGTVVTVRSSRFAIHSILEMALFWLLSSHSNAIPACSSNHGAEGADNSCHLLHEHIPPAQVFIEPGDVLVKWDQAVASNMTFSLLGQVETVA